MKNDSLDLVGIDAFQRSLLEILDRIADHLEDVLPPRTGPARTCVVTHRHLDTLQYIEFFDEARAARRLPLASNHYENIEKLVRKYLKENTPNAKVTSPEKTEN